MKVIRLSAVRGGHPYPLENIPGTHFCYRPSPAKGHSAAGRIMSMKYSNDTTENRTRDLQACSAVPFPTAPQRDPTISVNLSIYLRCSIRKIPYVIKKVITVINAAYLFQRRIVNSHCNPRAHRRIYPI